MDPAEVSAPAAAAAAAAEDPADAEDWREGLKAPRPKGGVFVTWIMISFMVCVHCSWVNAYTSTTGSTALTWCNSAGDHCAPTWVPFLVLQLIAMAWSYGCTWLFPKFPVICRLPFMLIGFTPAFVIYAWPFIFSDFGAEFAQKAPHWILAAWTMVRLCIESSIQTHHALGGQGVSWWLLWPCQQAPKPYTMTYPFCGCKVTRTRGGNCDAAGSALLGLTTAVFFAFVGNDQAPGVVGWAWVLQVWMFFCKCSVHVVQVGGKGRNKAPCVVEEEKLLFCTIVKRERVIDGKTAAAPH